MVCGDAGKKYLLGLHIAPCKMPVKLEDRMDSFLCVCAFSKSVWSFFAIKYIYNR